MDFDRWFQCQGRQKTAPPAQQEESGEGDLPDGVWYGEVDGRIVYFAQCRACERSYELCCDFSEFSQDINYCGGSPRCLP